MSEFLQVSNSSKIQVSEFLLLGFPGIHSWQHWLSIPMIPPYLSAAGANLLILVTIYQDPGLQQPMYQFLSILSLVDMGLATTMIPRILVNFWFGVKVISLLECCIQMYFIHFFIGMESGIFLCMAFDRYVAICHPLRYPTIVTRGLVAKAVLLMVLRNGVFVIPIPLLAAQRDYCSKNEIDHCLCSNLGVTSLACDDNWPNKITQLLLAWFGLGGDLSLILLSYTLILYTVLQLKSPDATSKALRTCSSHLILIFIFYTNIVVVSVTQLTEFKDKLIQVALNVLSNVLPPSLNPLVYAFRTKELRAGFRKVFALDAKKK
ncbi:olfactory receptor 56B1 [Erinaceus europaeus]|uniref:Olfactory receptor 56B1 n=1 Tax=Erinaceus europaeus TaxID=9365 RepID=A0A1S3AE79_ERIEU|nr:olfactory receptor 56B1 [Erinaceus europaeus]